MSTTIILTTDPRISDLVALAAGTSTSAVVVGPRTVADQVADQVAAVSWLDQPAGAPVEAFAGAVAELVAGERPDLVLASTRAGDRALAGAVAAALGAPVLTMVSAVTVGDGQVDVTRSVSGGIAVRTEHVAGTAVVVVDGGPVADPVTATAPVTAVAAAPDASATVVEEQPAGRASADLSRAGRIVAVGRGLKAQEDLALIADLAEALGAEQACSRPLAEGLGWFPHDRYVGVTGQHVQPDLYLAVGISGQLQHTVGARASRTVVAINSDKDCPFFAEADYCVVGDLYQVVPALTAALS